MLNGGLEHTISLAMLLPQNQKLLLAHVQFWEDLNDFLYHSHLANLLN